MKYIKAPILLLQAAYEIYHNSVIFGQECIKPDDIDLIKCSKSEKEEITDLRNYTRKLLEKAINYKNNLSVFSPACVFHCFDHTKRDSKFYQIKGKTINDTIGEFLNSRGEKQIILLDDVEWPNKKGCSHVK